MTQLTPNQHGLLACAAATETGSIEAPASAQRIIAALIKRGLLLSNPQRDGPSLLMITDLGREAIGAATAPPPTDGGDDQPLPPPVPKGKIAILVEQLRQPEGATVQAMMEATGWQAHSVRGALSGTIKKGLGIGVTSEKTEAGRIYRAVRAAQA